MTRRVAVAGACAYPVPQGSQVLLKESARCARLAGWEPVLAVYGRGERAVTDVDGIPIHRSRRIPGARKTEAGPHLLKPLEDAALVQTLRRLRRERAYDLVHAHNHEALLAALVARARPVVYHAHTAMAEELPYFMAPPAWARRLGAWLDRNLPRRADAVIAPHAALRDYLVDCGCEAGRVHVIPPPVDTEAIVPRCEPSGDPPPVLYAGNLDAYQNLPLLREAMRLVRERLPGARLRIATASEPRDWPDAEFVPAPSFGALQEALARDCVFACPRTSWAGYPMKLLNAMAAGLAVAACASCAPCVEHERTGLVCDGTPEGMARALLRLLEDKELRRDMGGKGRQWVQARHSLAAIAERQAAAYEEALAVRPRR